MEDHETNILFEHTKRLREGRLNVEQQEERASFETKARRKFAKQVTPTHVGLVVKRNRRKGRRLSESSGASGAMSEPRTPWFKERWSVQPGKVETSQAHGANHHSSQPTSQKCTVNQLRQLTPRMSKHFPVTESVLGDRISILRLQNQL
jgi:hypothetical protein